MARAGDAAEQQTTQGGERAIFGFGTCDTIALANQKGGVSKTTTAVNLAAALGQKGRRVLLIDLDKSTSALGVPPTYEGTYEVMLGAAGIDEVTLRWDDEELDDVTLPQNVDLVSSRRVLEGLEADLREKNKFADPVMTLRHEIERVSGGYDFVVADTPPDVSCPTLTSYQIFRWFIVSAVPQRWPSRASTRPWPICRPSSSRATRPASCWVFAWGW